jgi:hypothetical protein
MSRPVLFGALFFVIVGCTGRQETSETSAMSTTAEVPQPAKEKAPTDSDHPAPAGEALAPRDLDLDEEVEAPGDREEVPTELTQDVGKTNRDLADELRAAVGSPTDCLQDYRPSAGTVIPVHITAIVRQSGLIIEPSANGPGLSENDQRCIEQRLGDVVLAPLETEASRRVSTSIELVSKGGAVKEDDVALQTPKLNEVVEPLPKKKTIAPSGVPIDKAPSDRPDGPKGDRIEGPKGVPIAGPKPKPIDGYEIEENAERWTD